jgi:hypothetical protein
LKLDSNFTELDLRWGKTDYSLFLSDEELNSQCIEFNFNIEFCNKVLRNELDWWFTSLSARNTLNSPLFHHFLCFKICLKLAKLDLFPDNCLTDCNSVYQGLAKLKSLGRWNGQITHTRKRAMLEMFLKRFGAFFRVASYVLVPLFLAKVIFRQKRVPKKFSTLVDTFLLPGKEFSDRYYCGATDFLKEEEISRLRFVPTFHGYSYREYFSAIKKLRCKPDRFLLKEDFLTLGDALRSLLHSIRLFRLKIPKLSIGSFDFGCLIKEEFGRFGGLEDGVYGFMNFYFARRLSLGGVQIDTVVDWHENQGQDRAWNYGFHTFYPKTKTIGYNMVYISKWWLAFSPLPSERKKHVLPKTILTPSRYFLKVIQKNDPKIKVRKTGAFRYPKPMTRITNDGILRILVPLSHNIDDALNSIYKTQSILIELSKESKIVFNITYKSHPAAEKSALKNLTQNHRARKETWTERPLAEELRTADIVLGERTFALLESLNAGVPVGVIRSQDGLFHSSIPPGASSDRSLNVDSLKAFQKLIKIAMRRRSSKQFLEKPILEIPSRNLALEVFGLR